jgi:hypothetical protein
MEKSREKTSKKGRAIVEKVENRVFEVLNNGKEKEQK